LRPKVEVEADDPKILCFLPTSAHKCIYGASLVKISSLITTSKMLEKLINNKNKTEKKSGCMSENRCVEGNKMRHVNKINIYFYILHDAGSSGQVPNRE